MKRPVVILLAACILLSGCKPGTAPCTADPSPTREATPGRTDIPAIPSSTPTREATLTPSAIPPTATPQPTDTPKRCDPAVRDFCIEPGFQVFERPISPEFTDSIDPTYPYGSTQGGKRDPHHGVEFPNASGTPVLAAADGSVVYAGNDATIPFSRWTNYYGNLVIIKHQMPESPYQAIYTLYGHLSKIDVETGKAVKAGEKIGEVGMTGGAIGSHLHFEVRLTPEDYTTTLNPELWLIPHAGNGALAIRVHNATGDLVTTDLNVQYFPDPEQPAARAYPLTTYAAECINEASIWSENAGLGDLPAGQYRITFVYRNLLYEKWVEVLAGEITIVDFEAK
jgi:murein DD-endopeptidase MepM/ murein hydrolase activator NlpD